MMSPAGTPGRARSPQVYRDSPAFRAMSFGFLFIAALLTGCDSSGARLSPLAHDAIILAFGDSLTHGSGASLGESYPSVLQQLSGRKVINAGIPGEVSADGLLRLREIFQRTLPELVILCHGGNDFLRKLDRGALANNLQAMISLSQQNGAQVVLIGVPKPGLLLGTADVYVELAAANGLVAEMDTVSDVLSKASLKSDPIHPNARCYAQMAKSIDALLRDSGAY